MKIVFIGQDFTIYGSNAPTNLIHAFALGFQQNDCRSVLLTMGNDYAEPRGFVGPIEYYIPLEQKTRNKFFIVRSFYKLNKYLNAIRYCRKLIKKGETNILIAFTSAPYLIVFSYLLRKMFFDLSFIYLVEHPLKFKKNLNNLFLFYFKTVFSIFYDGQIFISTGLRKYFKTKKNNIVVPSMVISERFNSTQASPIPFAYIGYCGTITRYKDGVHILIKGFKQISAKYPLLKLVLIGDFSDDLEKVYFNDLVKELHLYDRVIFTGKILKNEMPKYLQNAKILVLARPKNLQSETGFPTKLPEYLATGKPVVVTRVGDIPKYLSDGENAFLIEPDDVDAVANAFETILSDYATALKVGEMGQLLSKMVFNPKIQARRVIEFITEIKNAGKK